MADALNVVPKKDAVHTGVKGAAALAEGLSEALADTYRLVFKTHACHWNVEGPLFHPIHKLTEGQYEEMFAAADEIAERIRALGRLTPMTMKEILSGSIVEDIEGPATAQRIVEGLADDHERVARRMHGVIRTAEDHADPVTADLLTGRSAFHEKAAWMLRATAK